MKTLRKILHLRGNKSPWPNPRDSIGRPFKGAPDGKGTYWQAKGPARDVWETLGPILMKRIENETYVNVYGSSLSLHFFMFGDTEDTAAPQVLVRSMEPQARILALQAIKIVMKHYPTIGVGEISQFSDLLPLAQDEIQSYFLPLASTGNEIVVLTAPQDKPFGRRLFVPKKDSGSLRPATAGPLLYVNGKTYQLTVGHAFLDFGDLALSQAQPGYLEQHEFNSQKEEKEGKSEAKLELTGQSKPVAKAASTGVTNASSVQNSPPSAPSAPEPSSPLDAITTRQLSLDSGVGLSNENGSNSNDHFQGPALSRKLDCLGKLALLSDSSNPNSPDYGLVELGKAYHQGNNEVPCGPNGHQRFLQVRRPAKDGPRDVNVITMTASSGFMTGSLCATAAYVRLPNQRTFQELYPIFLEGNLADGDCGSGVVDQSTGHMYGHIVAGTAGTGEAYIVPIEHVFRDIQEKLKGRVTMVPPGEILEHAQEEHLKLEDLKLSALFKAEYSKRGDPLRVVEFASEEYFRKLKQDTPSNLEADKAGPSLPTPKSTVARLIPNGHPTTSKSGERSTLGVHSFAQKQKNITRSKLAHPLAGSLPHFTRLDSRLPTANRDYKGKGKEKEDVGKRNKPKILPFEEHFFALPSDLQVHVVAYLCVPDILNLRLASKNWHEFVSANETPISRAFLERNPVPRFAIELYPLPASPDLNLHYIRGLWHRLSVTSKLSVLMTDWITTDIFLRKDNLQQSEFLPQQVRIRRRLIPLLFTIFHFFETYRHFHLKHLLENDHELLPEGWKFNPVARKIMNMYDNKTLLQVHQIFPFLLAYLDRKLRPPSFFGRVERSFRGYVRGSPPEHVRVGILCIGGLREMARLSEIENYDARITAVDGWYASISQKQIDPVPHARRWPKALGQTHSKQAPLNSAEEEITNTALKSDDIHLPSSSRDNYEDAAGTNSDSNQNNNSKPPTAMPMPPLSSEHARLLIPDLPNLNQIWTPTAEAMLIARWAVDRKQDIKKNGQSMDELILDKFTTADELFYGRTTGKFNLGNVSLGWGDLLGDIVGEKISGLGGDMLDTPKDVLEEMPCSIGNGSQSH
jgi:hypothetical protein